MKYHQLFVASSIVDFAALRLEISGLVQKTNEAAVKNGVYLRLFLCENAPQLVREHGSQCTYNREIENSDLFLLLAKEDKPVGEFTVEEAECAAKQAKAGRLRHILVGIQGGKTAALPPELACLRPYAKAVCFEDGSPKPLYEALQTELPKPLDKALQTALRALEKGFGTP